MAITAEFKGRPTIDLSGVPIAGFLEGKFGEEIFNEARARAFEKYNSAPSLLTPFYQGGVVRGSNPFYAVLVNEVLRNNKLNLHTATPAEIERTLSLGDVLGIKGNYYVDTGLVLRSPQDSYAPNDPLAKDLAAQIEHRLGKQLELSVMPLNGFDLKNDNNKYGLGLVLREDAEIIHSDVLNQQGKFDQKDINPETGLPREVRREGSRYLYTRSEGLSRLCVDNNLGLGAGWDDFGFSGVSGRVVICGEAAGVDKDVILKDYILRFKTERTAEIDALNQRYEKAIKILKGTE